MKAIFAVTALAAAISAQAIAADTEITTTANGAMDVNFILDMNADPATYDVDLKEDDFNYGLKYNVAVANGPFTGSLFFEAKDQVGTPATIEVKDLIVTDGAISFGQVGSLMETNKDEYVADMEEALATVKLNEDADFVALSPAGQAAVIAALEAYGFEVNDDNEVDYGKHARGVDVAFRYAVTDALSVQLQGRNGGANTATGLAAKYKATAGDLSYVVEAEVELSGNKDVDASHFVGAGLTYVMGGTTFKAAVNNFKDDGVAKDAKAAFDAGDATAKPYKDAITEYAVSVESKIAGLTLKGSWTELNAAADDDEIGKAEVGYTIDSITPSVGYEFTTAEKNGDKVWGKVAYAQDAIEASAKVEVANFDADTAAEPLMELRASYKNDLAITYYAEYDFQKDAKNQLTLGAKYKF